YHIGVQMRKWGSSQELNKLSEAMYNARELAMTRMEEEADQLGADGVVGVRLDVNYYEWGSDAAEFIETVKVDLAPDEVVTSVSVPAPPPDSKSRYYKFARGREFGIVNLAVLASGIGSKRTLRLVYGGIGATPVRAREAEDAFAKGGPVSEAVQDVLAAVRRTVEPQSDGLGSAEYRMHLIEVMTARALRDVVGGA
ncbi:MAG: heavy metal-binding domain-containing protein, partial [Nitrososphaerota archaeon]|nr:heavy metal-binding domain-containing protein [Nitrososphaerota archaeon]